MGITIEWILINIGIYPHRNGYDYIRDLVVLTLDNNNTKMKPLYEIVSKKYNASVYSVQNCVRKAIETAFNNGKLININEMLNVTACDKSRALTNSELIFLISNFLKSNGYDKLILNNANVVSKGTMTESGK